MSYVRKYTIWGNLWKAKTPCAVLYPKYNKEVWKTENERYKFSHDIENRWYWQMEITVQWTGSYARVILQCLTRGLFFFSFSIRPEALCFYFSSVFDGYSNYSLVVFFNRQILQVNGVRKISKKFRYNLQYPIHILQSINFFSTVEFFS